MDAYQDLAELEALPDSELWALVYRRLSPTEANRLHFLGSEEKRGTLSTEENVEYDRLLAQVNHDMLLRSKSLMLLKERGHDIKTYLKMGT